jgi:murein DD-endopeptidase MepM/ murein hydrolase activator NlpD
MSNYKRNGKGYYIALILCVTAIGITGYVMNRAKPNEKQPADNLVPEATVSGELGQAEIPVLSTQPQNDLPKQPDAPETQPAAPGQGLRKLKPVSPVSGKTVGNYAVETLSYNETTRDWRVHNGVDIAAETGAEVVASEAGEVLRVFEDETYGWTVEIRHTGGYTTCYASLGEDVAVKVGDRVTAGQTIGTVGETALVETAMGPHVHFSVSYQGQSMDPEEFLSLGA